MGYLGLAGYTHNVSFHKLVCRFGVQLRILNGFQLREVSVKE